MSKSELNEMIMHEAKNLSNETLCEVLDFIEFLKKKELKRNEISFETSLTDELNELTKFSLIHLEEEFANYKKLYPYEQ